MRDLLLSYSKKIGSAKSDILNEPLSLKLTGVTFEGRQENIKRVSFDTPLRLVRDRRNTFDSFAVMVEALLNDEWKEVGFIPAKHNKPIAEAIDNCIKINIRFDSKYGGDVGYAYGMSVVLTKDL